MDKIGSQLGYLHTRTRYTTTIASPFASDSGDESTGSSVSYIILSDSKVEDVASPIAVLNYAPTSNAETEPFEAPPSQDYAPALDVDPKSFEAPTSPD
ncbi:hypothetical protein Tco_1113924 [Tanacetum coccineum]|uniref:Uncharacterized protein n=1 Tax=Tanacetum coccineum TaxID=301880 RepID=A0ABQ5IU20_9ASTR